MPRIVLEFSIPEDPSRNVVTVTIEGPDPKQVRRSAMGTIDYYTGTMSPLGVLRMPDKFDASLLPDPNCKACRMSGGYACANHRDRTTRDD